jgi:hypothetical protein
MNAQRNAIRIIHEEHRSLSAVVDALSHLAQEIRENKLAPDVLDLLR